MSSITKDNSDRDTLYVLVTGANSGLGYAICTRLISTFLSTRPSNQHLYLITSTRSQSKADDLNNRLNAHIDGLAAGSINEQPYFHSESSQSFRPPTAEARNLFKSRITVDSVLVDLCALSTVFAAARHLNTRLPRLDTIICNAGIGGWEGIDWLKALKQFWNEGITRVVTYPTYQKCRVGAKNQLQLLGEVKDKDEKRSDEPVLGEVFCANFFGHYVLTHELRQLLSHGAGATELQQGGRIIWISTNQCEKQHFDLDDIQGLESLQPYESSKRLTDILVLGAQTVQAKTVVQKYLSASPRESQREETGIDKSMIFVTKEDASPSSSRTQSSSTSQTTSPRILLAHPGICLTSIIPLPFFLVWAQLMTFYIARWCGSTWHTITPHNGAVAPVWLTLLPDASLDEEQAELKKWGSMCNRSGTASVIETEVDDWGMKGADDDGKFAELAKKVWTAAEQLREEWTDRIASFEAAR